MGSQSPLLLCALPLVLFVLRARSQSGSGAAMVLQVRWKQQCTNLGAMRLDSRAQNRWAGGLARVRSGQMPHTSTVGPSGRFLVRLRGDGLLVQSHCSQLAPRIARNARRHNQPTESDIYALWWSH